MKRLDEADEVISKALELNHNEQRDLFVLLWFYRFAILWDRYPEAESNVVDFYNDSIVLLFDLKLIAEVAKELEHPRIERVLELADMMDYRKIR